MNASERKLRRKQLDRFFRSRSSCPKNCYLTGRAVVYLGSDGACHTFDLRSPFYAADFVLANHHKIVNASVRVASILKNTKFGDYQVPRRFVKKD